VNWAITRSTQGEALLGLGERESDPKRLHEAVIAFEAALEVLDRKLHPSQRASSKAGLATTLQLLGKRRKDPELLQQAKDAFEQVLAECTAEHAVRAGGDPT
jgi:hypothetical protein